MFMVNKCRLLYNASKINKDGNKKSPQRDGVRHKVEINSLDYVNENIEQAVKYHTYP